MLTSEVMKDEHVAEGEWVVGYAIFFGFVVIRKSCG